MEKVKLSMTFLPDTTSDDEPVARLQASHPAIMFGSDTAEATYPRFLRWHTREKGYLTLQEAIRKSTSFPAQRIGLKDRGLIKEGVWADLVVFDKETVGERVLSPTEYRVNGINYVLVNGEIAVEEGEYTGAIAGKGLRKHSVRARS